MAVELGLLKGRHPLLKDVDVTINLSKGLALSDRSSKEGKADKLLNSTNGNLRNVPLEMSDDNVTAMSIQSRLTNDIGEPPNTSKGLQNKGNSLGNQWNASTDAVVDEKVNSSDDESGQVLQTTQVVMNMLDVTMPGILSDEQKMKVTFLDLLFRSKLYYVLCRYDSFASLQSLLGENFQVDVAL